MSMILSMQSTKKVAQYLDDWEIILKPRFRIGLPQRGVTRELRPHGFAIIIPTRRRRAVTANCMLITAGALAEGWIGKPHAVCGRRPRAKISHSSGRRRSDLFLDAPAVLIRRYRREQ
jgi:hypothetical protein